MFNAGLSNAPQDLTPPDFGGRVSTVSDLPDVDAEDDSSYAWVVFRQTFADGGSRILARRQRGTQFDPPVALDTGDEAVRDPRIDLNGRGLGLATMAGASSGQPMTALIDVRDVFGLGSRLLSPSVAARRRCRRSPRTTARSSRPCSRGRVRRASPCAPTSTASRARRCCCRARSSASSPRSSASTRPPIGPAACCSRGCRAARRTGGSSPATSTARRRHSSATRASAAVAASHRACAGRILQPLGPAALRGHDRQPARRPDDRHHAGAAGAAGGRHAPLAGARDRRARPGDALQDAPAAHRRSQAAAVDRLQAPQARRDDVGPWPRRLAHEHARVGHAGGRRGVGRQQHLLGRALARQGVAPLPPRRHVHDHASRGATRSATWPSTRAPSAWASGSGRPTSARGGSLLRARRRGAHARARRPAVAHGDRQRLAGLLLGPGRLPRPRRSRAARRRAHRAGRGHHRRRRRVGHDAAPAGRGGRGDRARRAARRAARRRARARSSRSTRTSRPSRRRRSRRGR